MSDFRTTEETSGCTQRFPQWSEYIPPGWYVLGQCSLVNRSRRAGSAKFNTFMFTRLFIIACSL